MKRSTPLLLAAIPAAAAALSPAPARATGMQGHIYMALCAAEQVTDPRLRAVFDQHPMHLANGAFLVDSGYATDDHDQGEIPHWEGFIEAYLQLIREKYPAPYDSPEASRHIATLMGMAAHGITDSTFDTLLYARAEQVEPSGMESFDTAMDVFLVADMPRYFIPEYAYDGAMLSEAFTKVNHPVAESDVKSAISTARTGIAAVTNLLYLSAEEYGKKYPWGRSHFLDGRTPGSYAFGAKVVMGYYRELLRRLDGDTTADQIVIGTYPSAEHPLVTLDSSRPDGKVILFFGEGLDRASISAQTVTVTGPGGAVPAQVDVFRGDIWANVLVVTAAQSWKPGATYDVVLSKAVKTLHGASPKADLTFSFTTCASPDAKGDCPPPDGPPPTSACPITEEMYKLRPGEGGGGEGGSSAGGTGGGGTGGAGGGGSNSAVSSGSGCAVGGAPGTSLAVFSLLALGALGLGRRRRYGTGS